MDIKHIILITVASFFSIFAIATAEQPAADTYRQIFHSGNFYVEYSVTPYRLLRDASKEEMNDEARVVYTLVEDANASASYYEPVGSGVVHVLTSRDGKRMKSTIIPKNKLQNSRVNPGISITGIMGGLFNHDKSSKKSPQLIKQPNALYKDGKYYRFYQNNGMAIVARMISENDLSADWLDGGEGWCFVRKELAIPDELAVFCWNDSYRDQVLSRQAPVFNGSTKCSVGSKEYDCDQYVSNIMATNGMVVAFDAYNLLYADGKLVRIQKFFSRNGKETMVSDMIVRKLEGNVPEDAFQIGKSVSVYSAAKGDVRDFLGMPVQIGTIG